MRKYTIMAGNTLGKLFTVTTFGESHGPALGCIVDGCPPGICLVESTIQKELDRRRPGQCRFTTPRNEMDQVKILSGVFQGVTTGTPIGLLIKNTDQRSKDYDVIKTLFRPAHADFTYQKKYGIRDYRGGGRASARETAMRVAAGAIAKAVLAVYDIKVRGYLSQLGPITTNPSQFDWQTVENNPFFCPDYESVPLMEQHIELLQKEGNSVGAKVSIIAEGLLTGLGEPVFDRLDADLAHGLMSINAVKGVEIGDGFSVITQKGSEHRDEMTTAGFSSNHAGGIIGGISNGQPIIAHIALKPTSSIAIPGETVDINNHPQSIVVKGRHDPCVGIRAVPIAEAMVALILTDHLLRDRGQTGRNTINN